MNTKVIRNLIVCSAATCGVYCLIKKVVEKQNKKSYTNLKLYNNSSLTEYDSNMVDEIDTNSRVYHDITPVKEKSKTYMSYTA